MPIQPISKAEMLNKYARHMVRDYVRGNSSQIQSAQQFFNYANENKLYGLAVAALVQAKALFIELQERLPLRDSNRFENLSTLISDTALISSELKKSITEFETSVNQQIGRSLMKRKVLAYVETNATIKAFPKFVRRFLRKSLAKFDLASLKFVDKCKDA